MIVRIFAVITRMTAVVYVQIIRMLSGHTYEAIMEGTLILWALKLDNYL
jgi:hypothetical protein